ncbi:MAG: protein-glutamate O-methyltransferase CheR [Oscillospiraceae bacterium]|nr:protein-glutamate O-methyltransferase CheR [Oscillospiraceae bacterium]
MASHKITDNDFKRLYELMESKYGINLKQKRVLIEGRLSNTITQRGFNDFTSFLNMVFADRTGTEMIGLLNKLTTNHTFFMREEEHYKFMREVVLPYLEKVKADRRVYLWSAASSSGEEPYTNIMQLLEYFSGKTTMWNLSTLATDISQRVLDIAKVGVYSGESMKNLPETWKKKYFSPTPDGSFKVSPEVTKRVDFKTFNLMDKIPFRLYPFDLIFCRNVMIYFEMDVKVQLVNRLYEVTRPGGYLFIGHAESIPRDKTKFEYVKPAVYRRPLEEKT